MSTIQPFIEVGQLRALVEEALETADALDLEMVALHLSMARDALGEERPDG